MGLSLEKAMAIHPSPVWRVSSGVCVWNFFKWHIIVFPFNDAVR